MSTINKPVIPPAPDAECPACGSPATPRYTLLSGSEVCYLCTACGLEFNVLSHGRGTTPQAGLPPAAALPTPRTHPFGGPARADRKRGRG